MRIRFTCSGALPVVLAAMCCLSVAIPLEAVGPDDMESYDLLFVGAELTDDQAQQLEEHVKAHPDDMSARIKLLGFYFMRQRENAQLTARRRAHALWMIENKPGAGITGSPHAEIDSFSDPEGYVQASALWIETAEKTQDPVVLGNAASFFTLSDNERAAAYLERAKELNPNNPEWPAALAHLYELEASGPTGEIQLETAKKALAEYRLAYMLSDDVSSFYLLNDLAKAALNAEEPDLAKRYANELLKKTTQNKQDWNYGNAIHAGNLVLGLVALQNGDVESAKTYLLKAGQTPGSPQLDSFGPNMRLAKALLDAGEAETVIEYLKLCKNFWEMGQDQLDNWIVLIEAGRQPDFDRQLNY